MVSVNPSISMGNFKRYCRDKATSLNEFITMVKDRIPTPKEVSELEELYQDSEDSYEWKETAGRASLTSLASQCIL